MDQKLIVNFETIKNERNYIFAVQMGSPFADCLEVLDEYKAQIIEMAKQGDEKAKAEAENKNVFSPIEDVNN